LVRFHVRGRAGRSGQTAGADGRLTYRFCMTSEVWQPLSARLAGGEGLREGVPVALREPLRAWIRSQAYRQDSIVRRIQVRLCLPQGTGYDDGRTALHDWLADQTRVKDLLDVADALLAFPSSQLGFAAASDL
jgi:hypothetical protein